MVHGDSLGWCRVKAGRQGDSLVQGDSLAWCKEKAWDGTGRQPGAGRQPGMVQGESMAWAVTGPLLTKCQPESWSFLSQAFTQRKESERRRGGGWGGSGGGGVPVVSAQMCVHT